MKLHANHSNIERGGVQSETSFTIKTNALSFSILSSGLYTDPIMAIVRELSCNAYDAHVDANNAATPFEIHLPNDLEPFFSIKDFGTGLSDADIQGETIPITANDGTVTHTRSGGLYTTYFDSTKTESNDFIGALGLGSKSPFSYSEAFEVISRFKGTKNTYAIFLNEEGIPTVALMGSIETDEHSGLEIKIAIKKDDYYKFIGKTATALKYFKVKPIVKGVLNFEFERIPEYRIETETWMLSRANGYYNSGIIAVQGNIQYRVDPEQIKEFLRAEEQIFISKSNIVLFFNIGDLEVAANREEIRYDKQSVEAIVNGVGSVYENLTTEIESRIGSISNNYWDACIDLNELSSELFNNTSFIREHCDSSKVKSEILQQYITQQGTVEIDGMLGYAMYKYQLASGYNISTKRKPIGIAYTPCTGTVIIINDVKSGGIKRLTEYMYESNHVNTVILLTQHKTPNIHYDVDLQIEPYIGYEKELAAFKEKVGNPEILLLSEITEAEKRISAPKSTPYYQYNGVRSRHGYYNISYTALWERHSVILEDGGIYIPLKFGKTPSLILPDGKLEILEYTDPQRLDEMFSFLIKLYNDKTGKDLSYYDLHGMPASSYKTVAKLDNWVNLFDFAKEMQIEIKPMINYSSRLKVTSNFNGIKDILNDVGFVDTVNELPKKSTFRKLVMPVIEGHVKFTKNDEKSLQAVEDISKYILNIDNTKTKPFFKDSDFDKYEMLELVGHFSYTTNWTALKNYIKLVDRSK